jgi:tetratricopeptide (TPR) repeat protein
MHFKTIFFLAALSLTPAHALSLEAINFYKQGKALEFSDKEQALSYFEKALALDPNNRLYLERASNIYKFLELKDKYIETTTKLLAIEEKKGVNAEFLTKLIDIAVALDEADDFALTTPLYEKAITLGTKLYPDNKSELLAKIYFNYAEQKTSLKQNEAAIPLYLKAIDSINLVYKDAHGSKSLYHNNLAVLYYNINKYAEAETHYKRAIEVSEKLTPNRDARELGARYHNIANLYAVMKRPLDAEANYKNAAQVAEKTWVSGDHPKLAEYYSDLANELAKQGDAAPKKLIEAEDYYKKAVAVADKIWDKPNEKHVEYITALANYHETMKNFPEAEATFKKALAIEEKLIPDEMALAESYNRFARFYRDLKKHPESIVYYEKATALMEKINVKEARLVWNYTSLGDIYFKLEQVENAEKNYKKAVLLGEALNPNKDDNELALFYTNYGVVLHLLMKKPVEAERFYKQALAIYEANKDQDSDGIDNLVLNYSLLLDRKGKKVEANALRKKYGQ